MKFHNTKSTVDVQNLFFVLASKCVFFIAGEKAEATNLWDANCTVEKSNGVGLSRLKLWLLGDVS